MNKRVMMIASLVLVSGMAIAQLAMATFRGKAKDQEGKPLVGAIVRLKDVNTGRKYEPKTDAKGEWLQIGVQPGSYDVDLVVNGAVVQHFGNVRADLSNDNIVNFDLANINAAGPVGRTMAPAQAGVTPEQKKQMEELQKKNADIMKENEKRKQANALLAQIDQALAQTPPATDQAVDYATQITQLVPDSYLGWARLSEVASLAKKFDVALTASQKAIALVQAEPDPQGKNKELLANLHNNLGQAYARSGKAQEAIAEYNTAAQMYPTGAARYYFNAGAVLTNTGHPDEANTAFDKAIATDPNYADAYYQKGVNLLGKATIGKDGKMQAPEGTAEAFNKYLELQPEGKYAQGAKELLASIGAEVQTGYKASKKKKQ